jgi:MFS transporter, DHA1 family, multidrug resistance protein
VTLAADPLPGRRRRTALVALAATGTGGLWAVAGSLWAVLFACGLALPNAPALALSRHGEAAGTAAAH